MTRYVKSQIVEAFARLGVRLADSTFQRYVEKVLPPDNTGRGNVREFTAHEVKIMYASIILAQETTMSLRSAHHVITTRIDWDELKQKTDRADLLDVVASMPVKRRGP